VEETVGSGAAEGNYRVEELQNLQRMKFNSAGNEDLDIDLEGLSGQKCRI
jgi:hypothetical protein